MIFTDSRDLACILENTILYSEPHICTMCRAHSPNSLYVHSRHTEASHHLSKLTSVLVLVILLIDWQNTWQKQFQERGRNLDSQFEGTVHHTVGGTKMEMFSIRKQTEMCAGFPFVFFFFLSDQNPSSWILAPTFRGDLHTPVKPCWNFLLRNLQQCAS